jgi:hypothetical protein
MNFVRICQLKIIVITTTAYPAFAFCSFSADDGKSARRLQSQLLHIRKQGWECVPFSNLRKTAVEAWRPSPTLSGRLRVHAMTIASLSHRFSPMTNFG